MCLLPDDLQAQQLVIDAFTQCLLKEKTSWLAYQLNEHDKKEAIQLRKQMLKGMVQVIVDLGIRRALQLGMTRGPQEYQQFYQMDVRTRAVAWLRFQQGWTLDEIERTLELKRHEVIEKVHNARFLLMGQPPHWMPKAEVRV